MLRRQLHATYIGINSLVINIVGCGIIKIS